MEHWEPELKGFLLIQEKLEPSQTQTPGQLRLLQLQHFQVGRRLPWLKT